MIKFLPYIIGLIAKRFFISSLFFCLAFLLLSKNIYAAPPANFQTSLIIGSGLTNPTGFDIAPDGRVFVLQQSGAVRIYKNGQLLATPFATLPTTQAGGDLGLLGIAFDPNFNTNHYVYFYYTSDESHNTLARFDATGDTASGGPFILYQSLDITQQFHAGGTVEFGPDGKIYLSIGDNQYPPNGQDLSTSNGKILRLNPDGSIPSDNPFVGQADKLPEIWAYGVRNPFRFQFDSVSGRLYVGDVGQDSWEEVNLVTRGANYGWPICEGTCGVSGMTNPTYTYSHSGLSSSITGGLVYRGQLFPAAYQGSYFFGDYARGFMKMLTLDANGNSTGVSDFDSNVGSIVDIKQALDGTVYYLTIFPARLYQITYATGNHVPAAVASADITNGSEPLTVHFSSAGSVDPDGTQLTYLWDLGDGTTSTEANPTKVYNNRGTYNVKLTVSDGVYQVQSGTITIKAGIPPTVTIASPVDHSTYRAGDTIHYSASATDWNGQSLPDSAFKIDFLFHHHTHTHPFLVINGQHAGQFQIPVTGETSSDVWYEMKATATDSNGLFSTTSLEIFPVKVNVTLATNPPNLQILLDSLLTSSPSTIESVVGFQHEVSVPAMQLLNGSYYQFDSWSDGGSHKHFMTTPETNSTITANLRSTPPFTATYFNNINLSGSPVLSRSEGMIDHNFGSGSPDPSINNDNFSARYIKQHHFNTGSYKFETVSDDGVRLYIDNNLVIDRWIDQSSTPYSATVNLTEGDHEIKLEYYEHGGGAAIKLDWNPTATQAPSPTPTGTLTPTPTTSSGQSTTSYTLINADTNQPITGFNPISPNANFELNTLPTRHLNIRANTSPLTVGSVKFAYDTNLSYQIENNAPYAIASDNNGDYFCMDANSRFSHGKCDTLFWTECYRNTRYKFAVNLYCNRFSFDAYSDKHTNAYAVKWTINYLLYIDKR
jgi:glucose/arabinose dehydrogenase/chitodextrinase